MAGERAIVVGAGGIAHVWLKAMKAEGVEVAAVVDLRRQAAEEKIAAYQLNAIASDDLAKVLREVRADFLVDLTVPEAHCGVVCAALRAGLHVLGEKPMAATMAAARQMMQASEESGKLYMVDQSRRWFRSHFMAANTIRRGDLGSLTALHCDFYIGAHFGGFRDQIESPLLLDMAIHHFDLARMLSGRDALSVYCEEFNPPGSWYGGNAGCDCLFEMGGGVRFNYRGSWCAEGCATSWNGNWRVIGERGSLLFENDQPPHGQVVAGNEGFIRPLAPIAAAEAGLEYEEFRAALREMLRFLRTGERPQTECHDNIRSLAMVFAALESARTHRRVAVEV